jgi:hypothetical protein
MRKDDGGGNDALGLGDARGGKGGLTGLPFLLVTGRVHGSGDGGVALLLVRPGIVCSEERFLL